LSIIDSSNFTSNTIFRFCINLMTKKERQRERERGGEEKEKERKGKEREN